MHRCNTPLPRAPATGLSLLTPGSSLRIRHLNGGVIPLVKGVRQRHEFLPTKSVQGGTLEAVQVHSDSNSDASVTSSSLPQGLGEARACLGESLPSPDAPPTQFSALAPSAFPSPPKSDAEIEAEQEAEQERRRKLWLAALKPPMYSVGYIPVLVGGAAVFAQLGVAPWTRLLGFGLAAIFIIAWLNLSNDAFDSHTGVDLTKPESMVNLTGSQPLVFWGSMLFLALGLSLLWSLISATGDPRVVAMLGASIACGYMYQGPPFRLSYKGVGELLCFFAFGPSATPAFFLAMQPTPAILPAATAVATSATAIGQLLGASLPAPLSNISAWVASTWAYLSQVSPAVPEFVWVLSALVGASTSIILFTSHFHQIEGDKAAGKMSPLVRLGTANGMKVLRAAVMSVYAALSVACIGGWLSWLVGAASALSLPAARALVAFAEDNHLVPQRVAPLKKFACEWHIAFGSSLALGLITGSFLG